MKKILLILLLISLSSCDYFLEQQLHRDETENYVSPFMGTWIGNYYGEQKGSLTIDVAKNGYTSVTRRSEFGNESTFLVGMVRDDGALQDVSMDSGFRFYGNLNQKSGTWTFSTIKGTWTVSKQIN